MFAFAAALVALPLLAQSVFATDCTRSYTIQQGDICDSISAAKNVSTYQLAVVNNAVIDSACSNLIPGNTICLGTQGEDCSTTYIVAPNDTCDQIASKHGFNTTILYLNNPQIDSECSNIYIGEVLCASGSVQVPPAPPGRLVPLQNIPVTATAAHSAAHTSATAAAPHTSTTPAPSSQGDDGSDEDDEDLPFCDEL